MKEVGRCDAIRALLVTRHTGFGELITEESPERSDLEWRILRRYHESDEDAHRYEAYIADQGPSALIVVSPKRIISWDFN